MVRLKSMGTNSIMLSGRFGSHFNTFKNYVCQQMTGMAISLNILNMNVSYYYCTCRPLIHVFCYEVILEHLDT